MDPRVFLWPHSHEDLLPRTARAAAAGTFGLTLPA